MERWAALLPDRPAAPSSAATIKMIGRLPESAYISLLQHLPIPDITSVALCNRQLAQMARHENVWKFKVDALNYSGPGAIRPPKSDETVQLVGQGEGVDGMALGGEEVQTGVVSVNGKSQRIASATPASSSVSSASKSLSTLPQLPPLSSSSSPQPPIADDDDFGDFFSNTTDYLATLAVDSLPGSFDFDAHDDFASVSSVPPRIVVIDTKAPSQGDDLMMSFDDDDDDVVVMTNSNRSEAAKVVPVSARPKIAASANKDTFDASPVSPNPPATTLYRDIYIAHHSILLPYYLSLISHTTSSLIFTSPTLTPTDRSKLFSALTRFCSPLLAPTRSLPQRTAVLRNVQSACDFFESAMLAEFERADSRRDELAMREKASVLWELNGGSGAIQVFVQKREIFYDQSHNALSNLIKIETPTGDVVDGIDFTAMDSFMKHVLYITAREGNLISRVFPPAADVLIYFTERIANDVISDYITSLLSAAQALQPPLFLLATAATFGQVYRLVDTVLAIEPKSILVTKERAEDVIFRMFEPLMDDYLSEEADWIRTVLEEICSEWDIKTASDLAISDPTFLASQNPAQIKRNVLAGFTKVLLLPVTIIPRTAAYGFNVISIGATGAFNTVASLGAGIGAGIGAGFGGGGGIKAKVQPASLSSSAVAAPSWSIDDATVSDDVLLTAIPSPILHSPTSSDTSLSTIANSKASSNRFDRMQMLLSLDTALQLIQANRDCLKRVQTFIRYPGVYGRKVRDGIEEVFIILLQTMGDKHVCPAFAQATAHMASYKAVDHVDGTSVAPLVQFFELVHIGDTIQQMVQVYFDKELASYIEKKDFRNAVLREKKRFETSLDDSVATGLNAGVNILMNQVDHIIATRQGDADFNPPDGIDLDLQPSLACREVISCLSSHCGMLKGSTDKLILEVFHQEVGIRLHGILLKHLKTITVSSEGGFQLISDLNAYHSFVSSLRQPSVTAYFTSLKMVGEIFIVDSAKDLTTLVRDVSRYEGTLNAEDLYELCKQRADWKVISVEVDKQLFGLKIGEDCIVS